MPAWVIPELPPTPQPTLRPHRQRRSRLRRGSGNTDCGSSAAPAAGGGHGRWKGQLGVHPAAPNQMRAVVVRTRRFARPEARTLASVGDGCDMKLSKVRAGPSRQEGSSGCSITAPQRRRLQGAPVGHATANPGPHDEASRAAANRVERSVGTGGLRVTHRHSGEQRSKAPAAMAARAF